MSSSPDSALWLGVDLGTQSVRALAVSATGETLGSGMHPLTSHRDGPRHEQDPEEWWRAVTHASRMALGNLPAEQLGGVAVDGTSGTILLMDEAGLPLTPGLMYDDTRAMAEVERINEAGADLWARLGYNKMQAAWGLPKLLWLLRGRRKLIRPGVRLAHQTDFINRRLAGSQVATDTSNALKTGCDLLRTEWPLDLFEQLGIAACILPGVVRSGTSLGTVCRAASLASGIPEGIPIIAGMTDGCAAQIGAGALSVGSWNSGLGTTLVLKGVAASLLQDPSGILYSHRSPDGDWLPGGASSTGAGAVSREFGGRDLDQLGMLASKREPSGLVVYPLTGRGERFPFYAPEAREFSLGAATDEVDRYAGLLQGVGFVERLCFDYLDLLGAPLYGDLFLTGGGANSRYWSQLRADILGRAVKLPENPEPALGMAVLAASSNRKVAALAAEMVRIREVIDPQTGSAGRLMESYLMLVRELSGRGWLAEEVAKHATRRLNA